MQIFFSIIGLIFIALIIWGSSVAQVFLIEEVKSLRKERDEWHCRYQDEVRQNHILLRELTNLKNSYRKKSAKKKFKK